MMHHSPRFGLEEVAEAHRADPPTITGWTANAACHSPTRTRDASCSPNVRLAKADVATGRQDTMSLRHDTRCIFVAQQVEDIGRDKAIKPAVWLVESRQAGCVFDNGPISTAEVAASRFGPWSR
jgi:hypothetical protein